jgi:hypothetical protein
MKNFTFKLSLLLAISGSALLLGGCADGEDAVTKKLSVYSFNTAVVQYELTGTVAGEETLYIKGDYTADHKYATLPDGGEENILDISLGAEIYTADLNRMTAVKSVNSDYEALLKMSAEEQKKFMIKKALGLKESAEVPSPAGTKKIAGYNCDFYLVENVGSVCLWNNVVLEKEISVLGLVNKKTALSILENIDIDKSKFELPAGVILKN